MGGLYWRPATLPTVETPVLLVSLQLIVSLTRNHREQRDLRMVAVSRLRWFPTRRRPVRIAQIAPPFQSVPPAGYGGTERVVSLLTEELVRRGHEVTLFASGDSSTTAHLVPTVDTALWRAPEVRDPLVYWAITAGLAYGRAAAGASISSTRTWTSMRSRVHHSSRRRRSRRCTGGWISKTSRASMPAFPRCR